MGLRGRCIEKLTTSTLDVLIVGGGINGAVSAAVLSARGARVGLIDARDFAGFTSQQSSNLIWGGIKYMETFEFGLVANLCRSRNELMRSFPSTIKEIRFLATLSKARQHHPIVVWAGTWLYWILGRSFTRTPKKLSNKQIQEMESIVNVENSHGGVEYSDAYLHDNDARFVFNFIRSALHCGAFAANYLESLGSKKDEEGFWNTNVKDEITGHKYIIRSKLIINAAGAFVDHLNELNSIETEHNHVFSKGIHLVVPRVTKNERVLAFFADDGRLFFAIPMAHRTCIGTTDTWVKNPITKVTDEDREFVLSNINARLNLNSPLRKENIIAERCGVRPLAIKKGAKKENDFLLLSRKHVVEVLKNRNYISIYGGKLTDCINIGEEICDHVAELGIELIHNGNKWYGEPSLQLRKTYEQRVQKLGLDSVIAEDTGEALSSRLWRRYGSDAMDMLDEIELDRGQLEVAVENTGFRRCEISHLKNNEMVTKLEDFLRRRSKIELLMRRDELQRLPSLHVVCAQLFGEEAVDKYDEYFSKNT